MLEIEIQIKQTINKGFEMPNILEMFTNFINLIKTLLLCMIFKRMFRNAKTRKNSFFNETFRLYTAHTCRIHTFNQYILLFCLIAFSLHLSTWYYMV